MTEAHESQEDLPRVMPLEDQLADWRARWITSYDEDPFSNQTAEARKRVSDISTRIAYGEVPSKELVPFEVSHDIGIGRVVVGTIKILLT